MAEALRIPVGVPRSLAGVRRGAALAVSRGAAVAAQMAVQVAVGAVAGPAGIGLLQLHMAWSSLAGELVGGGEASRTLRDASVSGATGDGRRIRAGLRRAGRRILVFGLALAALVALVALVLAFASGTVDASARPSSLIISVLIAAPLFALARLFSEALKALSDPLAAVTLENLVLPATLLLACGAMTLQLAAATGVQLLLAATMGIGLASGLLGLRLASRLRTLPGGNTHQQLAPAAGGANEQWFLWLNGLLNIAFLQLPFLLMPWLVDTADIGRFAVAHKLVNIITTLLILLAAVYGPRFARAAAAHDAPALRRLLRETQHISLLLFTPTWLVLLAAATPLTSLFSLEAGSLAPLLLVLGGGQLANAATGLSGVLLTMSGGARREFGILLASATATLVFTLLPGAGADLAHIAAAIAGGIALRNALSYAAARGHILKLTRDMP